MSGDSSSQSGAAEHQVRMDLAACYHLAQHFGMEELIHTHFSARVPGGGTQYLVKADELFFGEVRASGLVKVDYVRNAEVDAGSSVNPVGLIIHSAIYAARPDVHAIIHCHTPASIAVGVQESGLLPISQQALIFFNRLAYHDYEGISRAAAEADSLVRDIGGRHAMLLRNHGFVTVGSSCAQAFFLAYYLERACQIQTQAQAGGGRLRQIAPEVCAEFAARMLPSTYDGKRDWPGLIRLCDQKYPTYRT